ncbi:MAG: DUF1934 domain-containing protein [Clostridia bacterium]|nr:DUF1934 domain-containing protein [Clostridia bacterium]
MKQVKIKILTTQAVDGEKETIKTFALGTLENKGDTYLLSYRVKNDVPTRVILDKTAPKATMEHNGRMIIEEGQCHTAPYQMGPYKMELGVQGKQVICRLDPQGGTIKLCYDLTINGTPAGETTVELFLQS